MEKLYKANEVAELLHLHEQTILRFVREGKIRAVKSGRQYLIKESDLQGYLDRAGNLENGLSTPEVVAEKKEEVV
jgi:excisionase family DNA binding protein